MKLLKFRTAKFIDIIAIIMYNSKGDSMKRYNYISIIDRVFDAYSNQRIIDYIENVKQNGISEHGFPRLTAILGILIAHGKRLHLKDTFCEMMSICCNQFPYIKKKNGRHVGNDFSVKEVTSCLLEIEKSEVFDRDTTDAWRKGLAEINPYETYSEIAPVPPVRIGNWAAFAAASEQARIYAGIGNESAFVENQILSQLFSFDENGMYRDPNEPMVYDFVTRLQLALALYFGFDGKGADELKKNLEKSADLTLRMQSVTGEIPFGGRSNQFLHNEAFYAALCEFYAYYYSKKSEKDKADRFRTAANKAVESILPWLDIEQIHHVKNFYSIDSGIGCEGYAYFDKYMITCASWLYLAHLFSSDSDAEFTGTDHADSIVFSTSNHFHKVFLKCSDYFVEVDTNADTHYDATGIGRIHKVGCPSALCLSVPFAKEPNYKIDIENPYWLSICPSVFIDDKEHICSANPYYLKLTESSYNAVSAQATFECHNDEGIVCFLNCKVTDKGITVSAQGKGRVGINIPVFEFDGESYTDIRRDVNTVSVVYNGHICTYSSENEILCTNQKYANRNGHYIRYATYSDDFAIINITFD